MKMPLVRKLDWTGPKQWWCIDGPWNAKAFDTWREAMDCASTPVTEPTA